MDYPALFCSGETAPDRGVFGNHSARSELYCGTMNTAANSVFDMLLWRSGAYLILLMTLGLFWWGNRVKRLFWAAVPLLGQIAGLVLVLYHQSYRYIAAVQILTLALVFCSLLPFSHDAEVSTGGTFPSTDESGPSCGDLG